MVENSIEILQNSMFFHESLEELHKHVSKEILPYEYGGTMGPFTNKEIHQSIMKHEKYFREVQEMAAEHNKSHSEKESK